MENDRLGSLRGAVGEIDFEILGLLNRRARTVEEIRAIKIERGLPMHDPEREQSLLEAVLKRNEGPLDNHTVMRLFREILSASLGFMERSNAGGMIIARSPGAPDLRFEVGGRVVGADPVVIAGPCSVESREQITRAAEGLSRLGVRLMRGGAFKPRTSPYSFQGLGIEGLRLMREAADRHGMAVVTEVMDTRYVEVVAGLADVLQIGARNMHNFALRREVGKAGRLVVLKRGMSATLEELMWAAEYVALSGEHRIILCDRGVRTFARETRNSLDIAAVPLLRRMTALPVAVDISHAAGRRDILVPLARAALAAGAQALMVEVHPWPARARSDASQQLSIEEFGALMENLSASRLLRPRAMDGQERTEAMT